MIWANHIQGFVNIDILTAVCLKPCVAECCTALFVMTEEEGRALLETNFKGYEAAWVYDGGALSYTEGISALIAEN